MKNRFESAKALIGKKIGPYTLKDAYWENKSNRTGIRFAHGRTDLFAELICDKCYQSHRMLFIDWLQGKIKYCKYCRKHKPKKRRNDPSGKVALGLASAMAKKEKLKIRNLLVMYSVEYVAKLLKFPESEIRLIQKEKR